MPAKENISSTKNIIELLFYGNNLVKVAGFLCAVIGLAFGVGFYFGNHHEEYIHSIEINNINYQHTKDINDAVDKKREANDKVTQQKVERLQTTVILLEKRLNGKH